eukprot:1149233-Pelagomonas_calceolata.AAC.2
MATKGGPMVFPCRHMATKVAPGKPSRAPLVAIKCDQMRLKCDSSPLIETLLSASTSKWARLWTGCNCATTATESKCACLWTGCNFVS